MLISVQKHHKTFSLCVYFLYNRNMYKSSQTRYNTKEFIINLNQERRNRILRIESFNKYEPFDEIITSLIYAKFCTLKYTGVYSSNVDLLGFDDLKLLENKKVNGLDEFLKELLEILNNPEKVNKILFNIKLTKELMKTIDIF